MNKALIIIYIITCVTPTLSAFWPFSEPHTQTESETIDALLTQQANTPDDPEISYNLGVAQYKNKQFDQAQTNFERTIAAKSTPAFPELMQRSLFNAGNCGIKHTLKTLPNNWDKEDTDVPNEVLQQAIATLKKSIQHFEKFLETQESEQAEKNKTKAEDLLKKLEKKRKEQKDQKGDAKKNDSKDDNDHDKSENDKKEESQDKQEVGDNQSKRNKDQHDSSGQQSGNNSSQSSSNGKDNNSDHENNENKENRNPDKHDQPSHASPPQPSPSEHTQGSSEKQENEKDSGYGATQGQKSDDDVHDKSMQALLESLDNDASQTHKELLRRKTEQENHRVEAGQKPW